MCLAVALRFLRPPFGTSLKMERTIVVYGVSGSICKANNEIYDVQVMLSCEVPGVHVVLCSHWAQKCKIKKSLSTKNM